MYTVCTAISTLPGTVTLPSSRRQSTHRRTIPTSPSQSYLPKNKCGCDSVKLLSEHRPSSNPFSPYEGGIKHHLWTTLCLFRLACQNDLLRPRTAAVHDWLPNLRTCLHPIRNLYVAFDFAATAPARTVYCAVSRPASCALPWCRLPEALFQCRLGQILCRFSDATAKAAQNLR